MTNEELAVAIRNGRTELIPQLWENVRRFVHGRSRNVMQHIPPSYGVTEEDLVQSGYFALCSAIEKYDPEQGSFLTVLSFYLKNEFAAAGGYAKTPDPITSAVSLDAPTNGDDGEGDPLEDFVASQRPGGGDDYTDADDRMFAQQLHEALEQEISKLPPKQQTVIRGRYWAGRTFADIAKQEGVSTAAMQSREKEGLRRMRYSSTAGNLRQYIELHTDYYRRVSASSYQRGAASSVEQLVLQREKLESLWKKKHRAQ